jgi:hypothetical protein
MSASITVQRAALFAVVAMSKAHVTGRANTWSGATMINRRLLIYGAPKAATGGTLTVGNVGGFYGYSDGTEGGTYGAITPNPRTISGKTGTVKVLYMTGRTYITMYIMWDGPGFPTDLIVSLSTAAGEPLPDVTLSYVDFFDDMAVYEFGGDPDLTEQLYEFFRANVGNTVPCEISDAMPQP